MLLKKDPFQLILIQPLIVQSASSEEDSLRHTQPLHVLSASCPPRSSYTKNALEKRSFWVNIDTAFYCPVSLQRRGQPQAHTQTLHVQSASIFFLPTSSYTKNALEKRSFSVNIDTASYCPVSLQRGGQPQAHTQPLHVQSASIFFLPTSSYTKNALQIRSFSVNIDTASYCPVSLQRGGHPLAHTQPLHVLSDSIFSYLQVLIRKMVLKKDPFS